MNKKLLLLEENQELFSYLKSTRLFAHLPEQQIQKLIPLSKLQDFTEGTKILEEGSYNNRVYFLIRGKVDVYSNGEYVVSLQRKGDIFGEMSVISDYPCSATIIAEDHVSTFSIEVKNIYKHVDFNTEELENTLYRLFAMVLTDKLALTTDKARHYEITNQELHKTQRALQRIHRELELHVDERTVQLQQVNEQLKKEIKTRKKAEKLVLSLNADLERHVRKLEQKNQDLEQFVHFCSHDLKESMRMISSHCQALMEDYAGQMDDTAKDYVSFAVKGTRQMDDLVNGLLQYLSLEQGILPRSCDTTKCVETAVAQLESEIERHSVKITCDPLPTVIADRALLTQVFEHLLENAIKYHRDLPPEIHIHAEHRKKEWHFSVKDNGVGIAVHHQERLFKIFKRLHLRDQHPGAGIGLAVCKKIIELHGGKMWMESEEGKGSTFYFTLPDHRRNLKD